MNKNVNEVVKMFGDKNTVDTFVALFELDDEKFDSIYPQIKKELEHIYESKQLETNIKDLLNEYDFSDIESELQPVKEAIALIKEDETLSENKKEILIDIFDNSVNKVLDYCANPRERVKVKVKKLNENAILPKYAHDTDAGADITSIEDIEILSGETKLIKTGLALEIPTGYEVQVRPRSGLSLKTSLRIANAPGTIDSSYRGEVGIIIDNIGKETIKINKGDKVAQLLIAPTPMMIFEEIDELSDTDRGKGGFGSTGVNNE